MQPVPSTSVVIVVHSPIALPELDERVRVVIVESGGTGIVRCDVSACREIDEVTLDVLARLQLVARRLGTSVQLDNAGARLLDLLALVGLSDVLPAPDTPYTRTAGSQTGYGSMRIGSLNSGNRSLSTKKSRDAIRPSETCRTWIAHAS